MTVDLRTRLVLDSSQFDNTLKKSSKEIDQFQINIDKTKNILKNFAKVFAIAEFAFQTLDTALNSNARTQLEWQSSVDGAKTSINQFFQSLLSGDWSVYENGIANAIGLAKEYQKQMRLAQQATGLNRTEAELYEGERNNYEHIITSDNANRKEKNDAFEEYLKLSEQEINVRQRDIDNAKKAIAQMLEANNIKVVKDADELQKIIFTYLNPSTDEYAQISSYLKERKTKKDEMDFYFTASNNARGLNKEANMGYEKALKEYRESKNEYLEEIARLQGFLVEDEMTKVSNLLDIINANTDKIGTIKKDMDDAKTDINKVANNENIVPQGSLLYLDRQIQTKRTELNLAISNADRVRINQELEALTEQKRIIEFQYKYPNKPSMDLDKPIWNVPVSETELPTKLPEIKPVITKKDVQINNDYVTSLNAVASAMSSVSSMTNDGASAWITWGANMLTAIAAAIPAISTLVTAKTAEAGANAVASATQTPVVGWLLAGAAVASVLAAVATLPSFSTGGIFEGNNTIGDYNLARVNAGEMILNNRQQRNLFNLLNENGVTGGAANSKVEFKIKGNELVGVLNNYNKKISKV